MENINIRELWNEMKELEARQTLSKNIIQKMIRESSGNEMAKIVNFEILNLLVAVFMLPLFGYALFKGPKDPAFIVSLSGGLLLSLILLFWQVYKISLVKRVDFAKDTIMHIAKTLGKARLLLHKERFYQFFYFPVFLFVVYVAIVLLVKGENIFDLMKDYIWRIILTYVMATAISLIIYRDMFKKINKVEEELKDLEDMKKG